MRERESRKMELVNVRDLFRRQDEYVDQTIAIGG
jgi:asparaginyl-tRNA synthetase